MCHRSSSKVKTAIFLPEHTEYLEIKINHLARPHWCMQWAPKPSLLFLPTLLQESRDLLIASLPPHGLQLLMTSTHSEGTSVRIFFCSIYALFMVFLCQRDIRYAAKIFFIPHKSIFALKLSSAHFNNNEILQLFQLPSASLHCLCQAQLSLLTWMCILGILP